MALYAADPTDAANVPKVVPHWAPPAPVSVTPSNTGVANPSCNPAAPLYPAPPPPPPPPPPPLYTHGAGVVIHDGAGSILLGLQRDGWSSFSGKGEDDETPRQTALRECGEETLYVFDERLGVSAEPIFSSVTPRGREFFLFEACVPYDTSVVSRFDDVRRSCQYVNAKGCRETRKLRWFRIDSLERARLRPSFRADLPRILEALRGHVAEGGCCVESKGQTRAE